MVIDMIRLSCAHSQGNCGRVAEYQMIKGNNHMLLHVSHFSVVIVIMGTVSHLRM